MAEKPAKRRSSIAGGIATGLRAIIALPLNMFYNTGIATYIWVPTNKKPAHREGKVQLIDATQWFKPLRKNLGKKNCELSEEDIARICDTFLNFGETEQSKKFPNAAFGYWKVTVERPLRLCGIDPNHAYTPKEIKALKIDRQVDENAPPVILKIHKPGKVGADPLRGLFEATIDGKSCVVEYEPTATCAARSRCPCWSRAESRHSSAARCFPTLPTPGSTKAASRPAMRSASPVTSISRSLCARSTPSAPTSWRWRRKPRGCWMNSCKEELSERRRPSASAASSRGRRRPYSLPNRGRAHPP